MRPAYPDEIDLKVDGPKSGIGRHHSHCGKCECLVSQRSYVAAKQRAVGIQQLRRWHPFLLDPSFAPFLKGTKPQRLHDRRSNRRARYKCVQPLPCSTHRHLPILDFDNNMSKAPLLLLQFQDRQGMAGINEQVVPEQRVSPRQQRSLATVGIILEAAAQVLEIAGEAGFNTNANAERAGVGIGSIYRYFPDKHAILVEMGRREMARVGAQLRTDPGPKRGNLAADRQAIRTFLRAFGERTRARRVVVVALLGQLSAEELQTAFARAEAGMASRSAAPLDRIQLFVLSRALVGAMRAAVLEDADFLLSQQFEDELVLLSRTYVSAVSGRLSD